MRLAVLALVVLLSMSPRAQDWPLPDYQAFAARVKQHLAVDEDRQSGYMYLERRTEQKLDGSGRTREESRKVYEVYPGLPGQNPYRRLIEEEGKPVAAATLARADRDCQQAVEAYAKRVATPDGYKKDVQQNGQERQRYSAAVDDLFRIYDIKVNGRDTLDGRDMIVATLMPKPNAKPLTDDGKIMRHFKAHAWIDEADAELVRADVEAIDDWSFGWGIFAKIHKGAAATYLRRKVNNETWLPAEVTWMGSARVLLFKQLRQRGVAVYSDYRKFTVDTSTTYTHFNQ